MIEYVNDSFTRITGYAANELICRKIRVCLRSNHTATRSVPTPLGNDPQRGASGAAKSRIEKKTGNLLGAETITPLRDARGEITHYLAIQEDVTEQKRDKEALVESEARFRHMAEMTGEWLWEQDPSGRYVYSSGAVRDILGFEPEEIFQRNYLDLQVGNGETTGVNYDREHFAG